MIRKRERQHRVRKIQVERGWEPSEAGSIATGVPVQEQTQRLRRPRMAALIEEGEELEGVDEPAFRTQCGVAKVCAAMDSQVPNDRTPGGKQGVRKILPHQRLPVLTERQQKRSGSNNKEGGSVTALSELEYRKEQRVYLMSDQNEI